MLGRHTNAIVRSTAKEETCQNEFRIQERCQFSCTTLLEDGHVVSGSGDKTLTVWVASDDGAFAAAQTLSGHTSVVMCVAPLDDGRIASGSADKTLIVWAAGDDGVFAAAQTLSGHTSFVYCVAQLDDRRLVSGSNDKTLKVWE